MFPELERTAPTPLYQQIQDWMREQITRGIWPEYYRLKSETDLAAELAVNRGTIRNAIKTLIAEGLLVRIHGRGTFVRTKIIEQSLADKFITFSEGLILQDIAFETRVIECATVFPSQRVASLLATAPNKQVFYLERTRYVGNEPLILLKNHVVCDFCPEIGKVDFEQRTLFGTLEGTYGMRIDWGRRLFEARQADDEVAEALAIDRCDPVMYVQQISYLENGAPIELSDLWIRGNRFRISAIIKRDGQHTRVSSRQQHEHVPPRSNEIEHG